MRDLISIFRRSSCSWCWIRWIRIVAVWVAAQAVLGGCDTDPSCEAVEVVGAYAPETLVAGTSRVLNLNPGRRYFASGYEPLQYRTNSRDTSVFNIGWRNQRGDSVLVFGRREGEADLSVSALAPCAASAWQLLRVVVLPDCSGATVLLREPGEVTVGFLRGYRFLIPGTDELAFDQTSGRRLHYGIESLDPQIVAARTSGEDRLILERVAPGRGRIVVTATDDCGMQAQAHILVRVAPCPPLTLDDETNYFPIAVGSRWLYRFSASGLNPYRTQTEGTTEWVVLSATDCADGSRTFVVESRSEWTTSDYRTGSDPVVTTSQPVNRFEVVFDEDDLLNIGGVTPGPMEWKASQGARPDEVTTIWPNGQGLPASGTTVELTAGVGLSAWTWSLWWNGHTGSDKSLQLLEYSH